MSVVLESRTSSVVPEQLFPPDEVHLLIKRPELDAAAANN